MHRVVFLLVAIALVGCSETVGLYSACETDSDCADGLFCLGGHGSPFCSRECEADNPVDPAEVGLCLISDDCYIEEILY